jgi:hypothetical protein
MELCIDKSMFNELTCDEKRDTNGGSATGIAIFVAGIVVGYIVDGVVIANTGQSIPDRVADFLTNPGTGEYTDPYSGVTYYR